MLRDSIYSYDSDICESQKLLTPEYLLAFKDNEELLVSLSPAIYKGIKLHAVHDCRLICTLCKILGYEAVIGSMFLHSGYDLDELISCLLNSFEWQQRYVLFFMIAFCLKNHTFEYSDELKRIFDLALKDLEAGDKSEHEAISYFLVMFLPKVDFKLEEFISSIQNEQQLLFLSELSKNGHVNFTHIEPLIGKFTSPRVIKILLRIIANSCSISTKLKNYVLENVYNQVKYLTCLVELL